jgi:protein involved in temperature-dependent protein secretion
LALAYNYGDHASKLLGQQKIPEARQSAQTAVKYAPNSPDAHMSLGMLDYLSGDKTGALSELQTAQRLDPNFRKQWDAIMGFSKNFAVIQDDKEFMRKLFPSTQ